MYYIVNLCSFVKKKLNIKNHINQILKKGDVGSEINFRLWIADFGMRIIKTGVVGCAQKLPLSYEIMTYEIKTFKPTPISLNSNPISGV